MNRAIASLGAADWLNLAAAPTFVLVALLTAIAGDSHAAMLCSDSGRSSLPTGMVPMYLLMAAFHLPPWFRLRTPPRS